MGDQILPRLDILNEKLDIVNDSIQSEISARKASIAATNRSTAVIGTLLSIGLLTLGLFLWTSVRDSHDETVATCIRGNDTRTSINHLQEGTVSLEEMVRFTVGQIPDTADNHEVLQQIFARLDSAKQKIDSAALQLRDCEHL